MDDRVQNKIPKKLAEAAQKVKEDMQLHSTTIDLSCPGFVVSLEQGLTLDDHCTRALTHYQDIIDTRHSTFLQC